MQNLFWKFEGGKNNILHAAYYDIITTQDSEGGDDTSQCLYMTIEYRDSINNILVPDGFFIGWQSKPSYKTFKAILHGSDYVIVAVDIEVQKLAGFITAISDEVLSAYIPLLEVRPEYQQHGIGTELVKRMLHRLKGLYMIDLVCELSVKSFYKRFGMRESLGMSIRNYKKQSGR